MSDMIT